MPGRLRHAEPPGRLSRSDPVGGPLGLQQFNLKDHVRTGPNETTIEVRGETNLLYQAVGRHFEPYKAGPPAKPVREVAMSYVRTRLSPADQLRAKAAVN